MLCCIIIIELSNFKFTNELTSLDFFKILKIQASKLQLPAIIKSEKDKTRRINKKSKMLYLQSINNERLSEEMFTKLCMLSKVLKQNSFILKNIVI